jgi:hypothetical protein
VFATQPEEQSTILSQQRTGHVTGSKFSNPAITGYASTGARQWVASVPVIYGEGDEMPASGGYAELPAVGGRNKVGTGPVTGPMFSNPAITGYASTGVRQWVASVPLIHGGGDKIPPSGGYAELPAVGGRAKVRDLQKEVEKENEVSTGMECQSNVPYAIFLDCAVLIIIVGWGMAAVRVIGREASDCWRK